MAFADKLMNATHATAGTDRLLNAAEAASLLGLQPGTMYDLIAKGQIDFVKLFGKTIRFRESVIRQVISDSEVKSTNPSTLPEALKRNRKKTNGAKDANHSPHRRGRGLVEVSDAAKATPLHSKGGEL
jgi:excisionase family DNA binding protein